MMRCYLLLNLSPIVPQLAICRTKFSHKLFCIQCVLKYYNKYCSKYYSELQLIKFTAIKVALQNSFIAQYFKNEEQF